jgi:hypothetical protein
LLALRCFDNATTSPPRRRQVLNAFCGFDGSHHTLTEARLRKMKKALCLAELLQA